MTLSYRHPRLWATLIGLATVLIALGTFAPREFMLGYLVSFVFWVQTSVGALGLLCIHNITGGRWGKLIRPFLLWSSPTFFLLLLLFVPLIFVLSSLYPWADPTAIAQDPGLARRTLFMNQPFFIARSLIYIALWCGFALWVSRRVRQKTPNRALSGVTLLLLLFTFSFAAMDWIMTLDAKWSATGFGAVALTGALSNGVAFSILMTVWKQQRLAVEDAEKPLLIDLGNLLLMSVMLWAYLDFTQYLIIWSGQLPREIRWYDARSAGPWLGTILLIFALHFVVPFCALVFRGVKRSPRAMGTLAFSVLIAQALENVVWAAPSVGLTYSRALGATALAFIPIGLLWCSVIAWRAMQEPAETYRKIALEVAT